MDDSDRDGRMQDKITRTVTSAPTEIIDNDNIDDATNSHMQEGVKQVEALTMSWTKTSLGVAYALYV